MKKYEFKNFGLSDKDRQGTEEQQSFSLCSLLPARCSNGLKPSERRKLQALGHRQFYSRTRNPNEIT